MFRFESKFRSHDLCGNPTISFYNYEYMTDDPVIAERIRKACGRDIWEITPELYQQQMEEGKKGEAPKRRGRPPKVKIVDGMRTSEANIEGEQR
jgi:hypothetical protein